MLAGSVILFSEATFLGSWHYTSSGRRSKHGSDNRHRRRRYVLHKGYALRTAKPGVYCAIGALMSILLITGLLTGCKPTAPTTSVDDSGVAFERIELFTTDGVELRSRPLDWRSAGGENGTVWCTLNADDTINYNLYHSVEYHGGYAYFAQSDRRTIRRAPQTGTVETVFTNDTPMLDWRISLGGKYVAIYREDGTHIDIWSIDPRTLVQTIEAQTGAVGEPGNPSFDQFGTWSFLSENGKSVSTFTAAVVPDAPAGHVVSLLQVHIDESGTPSVEVQHIAETARNMLSWRGYVFDPQDEIIACDTYPFIVNTDSARTFAKTGTTTRLYVYSLRNDKIYVVDERSTCRFLPSWIGPGALEFNITPTTGTEAPGPFKGSYAVRNDILSLIETGLPALAEDNHQMLLAAAWSFVNQTMAAVDHHMTRQPEFTVNSSKTQAGKIEVTMGINAEDILNRKAIDTEPVVAGELQYLQDHEATLSAAAKKAIEGDIASWRTTIESAMAAPSGTSYSIKIVGDVDAAGNIDAASLQVYMDNGIRGSNYVSAAEFIEDLCSNRTTVAQAYANAESIAIQINAGAPPPP